MCSQEEDLAQKSFGRYSHRVRAIRYQVMGQNEHRILPPPAAEPVPPDNPRRAKKERIQAEFPCGTAALAVRPTLHAMGDGLVQLREAWGEKDRKSTRLNSSHLVISYAVFCLKKKKHAVAALKL